jgi:hypothetical protein
MWWVLIHVVVFLPHVVVFLPQVCLPASVLEHLEPSECVFKLSSSVKTSRGVGKIAMTQRRLFLLTDGRPGYVEVAQYRDIEVREGGREEEREGYQWEGELLNEQRR